MLRSLTRVALFATASSFRVPVMAPAMHPLPIVAHHLRGGALYATAAGSLEDEIKAKVASDTVVMYSKSTCPFCKAAKEIFDKMDQPYTAIELNEMDNGPDVQAALLEFTGQRTVPNVFIAGKHLGGYDDTNKAAKSGELAEMLK